LPQVERILLPARNTPFYLVTTAKIVLGGLLALHVKLLLGFLLFWIQVTQLKLLILWLKTYLIGWKNIYAFLWRSRLLILVCLAL